MDHLQAPVTSEETGRSRTRRPSIWALCLRPPGAAATASLLGGRAAISCARDRGSVKGAKARSAALGALTSGVVATGSGGWALLTALTVPFLAVTALATTILWLKQRRTSFTP